MTRAAPRGEADLYGEPVAEHGTEDEYWEAYSSNTSEETLFVAHYVWDGEWVKDGLDRHKVQHLFNADGWPTD